MSAFVCLLAPGGESVPAAALARRCAWLSLPPRRLETVSEGRFAAAFGPEALRPLFARRGEMVAVGDCRLDNRAEVLRLAAPVDAAAPDLEVALAAFAARGEAAVPALVGDFGFVVWDARAGTLTAVRDALGVRPLFHARVDGGLLAVSSRLEALADERYDEEWIAGFLLGGAPEPGRTVWAGCRGLPPGGLLTAEGGEPRVRRWWRAEDFAPAPGDERAQTEEWLALFTQGVRAALTADGSTWSQLSGGLDSSSIVSLAQHLAARGEAPAGLGGTFTMVDTLGDGDERRWSDTVVRRWGVRNETLVDPWPWEDDGRAPVPTDEPRTHFAYWTRDRRMWELLHGAGCRVMLSGQGSDHYLSGRLTYAADLLATGRLREAAREVAHQAVAERQSFWRLGWENAVAPLLPAALTRGAEARGEVPEWVDPAFAHRVDLRGRLPGARRHAAPRGGLWAAETAGNLGLLANFLERNPHQEGIEIRYPFLHRPLVEFSLRLPVRMRLRPGTSKWVLREAMRGILPEEVRTRRGKGGIDSRVLWALGREAPRIRAMLRDPLVAQMGWVRADALRAAAERARCGEVVSVAHLFCTLSLETWLRARSGRWDPDPAVPFETDNSAALAAAYA